MRPPREIIDAIILRAILLTLAMLPPTSPDPPVIPTLRLLSLPLPSSLSAFRLMPLFHVFRHCLFSHPPDAMPPDERAVIVRFRPMR
jgi:hypothetical protein